MRLNDGSWLATDTEVDRANRVALEVFTERWGRDYDEGDPTDYARMKDIMEWQSQGYRLPGETHQEAVERLATVRAVREAIDP